MAEERNLGVARAADSDDTDSTKAELQRRMEEARESITQTVTEIKDTVANQYQAVRDTVTEALDWREQYRKRPVAFSIGALSAGFILGYTVAGTFKEDDADYHDEDDYPTYDESDAYATTGARPAKLSASSYAEERSELRRPASYSAPSQAAEATSRGAYGSTGYEKAAPVKADYGQQSLYSAEAEAEAESGKPGLIERFKETRAYDKLQEEVSVLGDRFIEELSSVGRNVVLPALFGKVKELFGVDLSNKQRGTGAAGGASSGVSTSSSIGSNVAGTSGGVGTTGGGTGTPGSSAGGATGGSSSSSSYATSENRPYQNQSPDRA
jgi:hypothetical protein